MRTILMATLLTLICLAAARPAGAQDAFDVNGDARTAEHAAALRGANGGQSALFYSIAITMGISCISAGYAVGKVGAAALGAAAEKPELLGRALIFVGLAEGIAIYGLIIGIMLINQIGG